jgi:hypothetical protein
MTNSRPQNINHDDGTRLQALAIAEFAIAKQIVSAVKLVSDYSKISTQRIYELRKQARARRFDLEVSTQLKLEYVQDAPRSGAPKKLTPEIEEAIKEAVRRDRYGREKSCAELAAPFNLSANIIFLCLRNAGFRNVKSTMEPGLSAAMMKARLQFCLRYEH